MILIIIIVDWGMRAFVTARREGTTVILEYISGKRGRFIVVGDLGVKKNQADGVCYAKIDLSYGDTLFYESEGLKCPLRQEDPRPKNYYMDQ